MKYYVVIEHIKLGRDMSSTYHEDMCHECLCDTMDKAYKCTCDCHIEIREQQKIVVEAHDLEDAEIRAGNMCTLEIIGDSDMIDSGLAANQDKFGIVSTSSEVFKSYD